tara:strand:- start:201 stop:803 length:603 start_codon:yes stop_codon:yes gene_type:complete
MAVSEKGAEFLENSMNIGRATPGQSLTNSKEEPSKWERAPDVTEPREAMHLVFDALIEPETTANVLLSISKGVGVIDIASIMLYTGFIEGKWNPDMMLILMEPTMYMIMALSEKAEIEYVLETGDSFVQDTIIKEDVTEKMNKELTTLEDVRKAAVSNINPQAIPKEIQEKVEAIEISPSLLDKIGIEKQNDSLLNRGEQ